jgi:signal transduction histidine kinase
VAVAPSDPPAGRLLARLAAAREAMSATRIRLFATDAVSGLLIALPVFFLGRSHLPEWAFLVGAERLLRLHVTALAGRLHPTPVVPAALSYLAAVVVSAAAIAWAGSMSRMLAANGAVFAAFAAAGRHPGLSVPPAGPAAVVALMTAAAVLDHALERRRERRRARELDGRREAGVDVVRHIAHCVNPAIRVAVSPLEAVREHLVRSGRIDEVVSRRRDGGTETAGEAIEATVVALKQIRDVLEDTERIFGDRISPDDFEEVDLFALFRSEIAPVAAGGSVEVRFDVQADRPVRLHRTSFVQAVRNLIRNAEVHGFPDGFVPREKPFVRFEVRQTARETIVDCTNNGAPFPEGFSTHDFLAFGRKGKNSRGRGLGGAWIRKFVEIHGGTFRKVGNDPVHFRIALPRGRGW